MNRNLDQDLEERLSYHVDAAVRGGVMWYRPWPFAVIKSVLPQDLYVTLMQTWPMHTHPAWSMLVHPDQEVSKGKYRRRQMRVGEWMPELGNVLESSIVELAFRDLLGCHKPVKCYPQALLIDDEPGYWIRPHPDTPQKLMTVQFFIAPDESQPGMGTSMIDRNRPAVRHHCRYAPNEGFAFVVTDNSYHEVQKGMCPNARRSIQILYYTTPNPNIRYV